VSHIGGDRFAGNVLVLPDGLYYGRVTPWQAGLLVARHRRGELDLDHLRGRASLPFMVQAAEIFLRRKLTLFARPVLRVAERDSSSVTFEVDGVQWRVEVRVGEGPPALLTCQAANADRPPVYELEGIEKL